MLAAFRGINWVLNLDFVIFREQDINHYAVALLSLISKSPSLEFWTLVPLHLTWQLSAYYINWGNQAVYITLSIYLVKTTCIYMCAQSCLTLCDPMNCNPPGSSVHGIFLARILEWVAIPFSRGSSQPRNQTWVSHVSCIAGRFFTTEPQGMPISIFYLKNHM